MQVVPGTLPVAYRYVEEEKSNLKRSKRGLKISNGNATRWQRSRWFLIQELFLRYDVNTFQGFALKEEELITRSLRNPVNDATCTQAQLCHERARCLLLKRADHGTRGQQSSAQDRNKTSCDARFHARIQIRLGLCFLLTRHAAHGDAYIFHYILSSFHCTVLLPDPTASD